ncbi:hypothetical protein CRI94_14750 [Longibacter salinarum]|uniref:histidine kinase n=1 Tax=Longibacter salinarum TaxID=1850348 RepID=A0A2A8CV10_9BACT|nr:hypothetical protein CRI94_14750 [Longibacter salinarum]
MSDEHAASLQNVEEVRSGSRSDAMDPLTLAEKNAVTRDAVDAAITQRVYQYTRPVSAGLAVMYAGFSVLHVFALSPASAWIMSPLAAITALVCFGLWVAWKKLPVEAPYPHMVGAFISALVIANVLTHIAVEDNLEVTTHLILMLLGTSVLLLSSRWLALVIVASLLGWGTIVLTTGPYASILHYATTLLTTTLLSGIIHIALRRATRQSERRRLSAERLQTALSRALDAEARARRQLEDTNHALETAVHEAEELNEMQAAFLSDMSHEIRTPLTSIIGFAEVLSEENPADAEHFADLIRQSSERLMETVNSVLDLSKLKRGVAEFRPERVDVDDLLQDTLMLFRGRTDAEDMNLALETPKEPVVARLDPSSLNRITSNLVSNAVKFCDAGDDITVRLEATDDTVSISVEDTGPGIRPEFRAKLFEPFHRDESLSRQGTGLGLTITRRLVEAMDGTIEVDSVYGEGTTFTVTLPRSLDEGDLEVSSSEASCA